MDNSSMTFYISSLAKLFFRNVDMEILLFLYVQFEHVYSSVQLDQTSFRIVDMQTFLFLDARF